MNRIVFLAGVLVVLSLCRPLLRVVLAGLFAGAISKAALAKTPDSITLEHANRDAWKNAASADALARPLLASGFADAGIFTVSEMPGLVVRLLFREEDALRAAVYEHPIAGRWAEIYIRYLDGTSATFTTANATGLEPQPGHLVVHAPGLAVPALIARVIAERPAGATTPTRGDCVAREFEEAYEESMTWRKQKGMTTKEVVAVARRKPGQPVG